MNNKEFYTNYHDEIIDKRLKSEYKLRQYAHRMQYNDFVEYIKPGMKTNATENLFIRLLFFNAAKPPTSGLIPNNCIGQVICCELGPELL